VQWATKVMTPCFYVFLMEARLMTFKTHCTVLDSLWLRQHMAAAALVSIVFVTFDKRDVCHKIFINISFSDNPFYHFCYGHRH